MTPQDHQSRLMQACTRHALFWLTLANAVGLLCAWQLLFPNHTAGIALLGFGRLMTLHTNAQLYGWCSLPLILMLFHVFQTGQTGPGSRMGQIALWFWSAALVIGGWGWLSGHAAAKPFLEWSGPGLILFCIAMWVLWFALFRYRPRTTGPAAVVRGLTLAGLFFVPPLMFFAMNGAVYPPVNPTSGGATGHSLFGSTMGMIVMFLITPYLFWKPNTPMPKTIPAVLLFDLGLYLLLHKGNASNHEGGQIFALFSLGVWIPLLVQHYRRFGRAPSPWAAAFLGWGALLWFHGSVSFLPGILTDIKFSNGLVAHAHLAMAGMVTAFCMLILTTRGQINGRGPVAFFSWQFGLFLQLVALTLVGILEAGNPGALYEGDTAVRLLYGVRFLGGALMLAASACWLWMSLSRHALQTTAQKAVQPLTKPIGGMVGATPLWLPPFPGAVNGVVAKSRLSGLSGRSGGLR